MDEVRTPLLITRMSLSTRSAIGVQTNLLVDQLPEWRHAFWWAMESKSLSNRSLRMESLPFSRLAILKRDTAAARLLSPLSWWKGDQPKAKLLKHLRRFMGPDPGMIYAAPLDLYDARRMQAMLEALGLPYVLHLWDLLDANQRDAPPMRWLIEHACHVFCITQEIADAVSTGPGSTTLLRCHRRPSKAQATPPSGKDPLRIVMIGDCGSYASGMDLLNAGAKLARARRLDTQFVYIGREKATVSWRGRLEQPLEVSGFLESDDDRDRALASGHAAFLPGPYEDPETDPRSRFSIPSRVLDFMAIGLPIIGSVHPCSATAKYMNNLNVSRFAQARSGEDVANALLALADPATWAAASAASLVGYAESNADTSGFRQWMLS